MYNNIETKIMEILSEEFDVDFKTDSIGIDKRVDEIGLNSLKFIQLIVRLETEFSMEFMDDDLDIEKFPTLRDVAIYISNF